jgi:hypothetical protein
MWIVYRVRDSIGRHYVYGRPDFAPYDPRIQFRPVCASDNEVVAAWAMDALLRRKIVASWRRADRVERDRLLQSGLGVPKTQEPPHMTEKVLRFDRLTVDASDGILRVVLRDLGAGAAALRSAV